MTTPRDEPGPAGTPLEGRADPQLLAVQVERGEAGDMALLAGLPDDDFADFALAAAIQRELEAEDEASIPRITPAETEAAIPRIEPVVAEAGDENEDVPGVTPLRPAARPARRVDRRWLAAAAVLAGVTLLPLTWRASQGGAVREPSHAVAMLENPSAGLPPGFEDDRPWSRTRGGEVVSEEGRSARVGAYMVNLELAIRSGDAENTRLMANRIKGLLTDMSTSGTVAAGALNPITDRPDSPPAELLPVLEDASTQVAGALDADRYLLGAWAEAARLAVMRRDAAFFREARTRRTLEGAEALVGDDEGARAALTVIRNASEAGAPDWTGLSAAVGTLLRAIAS